MELGELDSTFKKSEISQLKGFLSSDSDMIRRPYDKRESHYARRTVYFGSVNPDVFLNDDTGNTRFWVIKCHRIHHLHSIDVQQLWAEVLTLYRAGETWRLTEQEVEELNANNEEYQSIDPIEERMLDWYGWGLPAEQVVMYPESSTSICMTIGITNPGRADTVAAGKAARKLTGRKPDRERKFLMPRRRDPKPPPSY